VVVYSFRFPKDYLAVPAAALQMFQTEAQEKVIRTLQTDIAAGVDAFVAGAEQRVKSCEETFRFFSPILVAAASGNYDGVRNLLPGSEVDLQCRSPGPGIPRSEKSTHMHPPPLAPQVL
jgi:hypothetical protein